jgi:excisionase family DNA binding protein
MLLSERLVYTVPEAGKLLGLGRNAAYDAAKRGDIPTLRIGRLLLVPKGPFHRMVGADIPGFSASIEANETIQDEAEGASEEGAEE